MTRRQRIRRSVFAACVAVAVLVVGVSCLWLCGDRSPFLRRAFIESEYQEQVDILRDRAYRFAHFWGGGDVESEVSGYFQLPEIVKAGLCSGTRQGSPVFKYSTIRSERYYFCREPRVGRPTINVGTAVFADGSSRKIAKYEAELLDEDGVKRGYSILFDYDGLKSRYSQSQASGKTETTTKDTKSAKKKGP